MKPCALFFSVAAAAFSLTAVAQAQQDSQSTPPQPSPSSKLQATSTVVVTADFVPQPLLETNRSVDVLPLTPLLTHDVEDTLRTDPTVDLEERGPDGTQADVSIRGGTFEQSLILVNGLRVNDVETGHLNMDISLPPGAISRIEVLHGAGSTFYGSDAMGGAVNFITTAPSRTSLALAAGGGNFGSYETALDANFSNKRLSESLSGARDFSDGFMADRDYRADIGSSETWFKDVLGGGDFLLGVNDRPYGANNFYGPYNSWERTKGWFTAYRQQLGSQTEADIAYRRHTDEFILFRNNPSYYENNHIDHSWQAMVRRHNDPHANTTLSYGIEADGDQIASSSLGNHGRNRGSGYVNLDLHAFTHFTLSAGAREELFDGGRNVFSPSLSAGYWLPRGFRLRASSSRGFRLPTFTDLYYSDPSTLGNPNLRPEQAWDFEGGADWNNNHRLSASLTFFHSHRIDGIDYIAPVGAPIATAENIDLINFNGVESSAKFHLAPTQDLIFAYTGIESSFNPLPGYTYRYASSYPSQNATFTWQGTFHHQLSARTRVGVLQRYQQTAYPLWDVSFSRNEGRFRPYLQLNNLSNTGYAEVQNPAVVLMPGRSFIAGMQYFWSREK